MRIPFTKMQGLGNDFVVISADMCNVLLSTKLIRNIANRNFGIGCDQILVLKSPTKKQKNIDFTFRIFNADGSEAFQCINGIRCLTKFVVDNKLSRKRNFVFATRFCNMQTSIKNGGQVTVVIDKPVFDPKGIPFVAEKRSLRYNLPIAGYGKIEVGVVSVGNPHAVILQPGNSVYDVEILGALISKSSYFPKGVNVDFMRVLNRNQIELRVCERGSGETLSCGSGACAAVVIGRLWGLLEPIVKVKLRGGDLLVNWDGLGNCIKVTGPAEKVFIGEINL